uniref:Uncharacterized protein n=1 Tax=Trypanosoma vivax (strain Y486) TaxID=1055687 RepID=G0UB30_TRYVY|nr:hypothetical protein TVY486_1105010 [Trypanosoma vivax Y486]
MCSSLVNEEREKRDEVPLLYGVDVNVLCTHAVGVGCGWRRSPRATAPSVPLPCVCCLFSTFPCSYPPPQLSSFTAPFSGAHYGVSPISYQLSSHSGGFIPHCCCGAYHRLRVYFHIPAYLIPHICLSFLLPSLPFPSLFTNNDKSTEYTCHHPVGSHVAFHMHSLILIWLQRFIITPFCSLVGTA